MVQIFTYMLYSEHKKIVQKFEPMKIFARDDETTQFFLTRQLFVYYDAPDVNVNMVASYYHHNGERSMHRQSLNEFNVCPRGCGLKGIKKCENYNFEILFSWKIRNYTEICTYEIYLLYSTNFW